jgi:hypothetical protein
MSARLETTKATLERELRANEDFVEVVKRHESRALDLTRRLNEAKRERDEHASLAESFEGKAVDRDEVQDAMRVTSTSARGLEARQRTDV